MNLKIFNFETVLNLSGNTINIIEVEDIRLFRKIVETIQYQITNNDVEEKVYIYDEDFQEINFRNVELIMNYIDLFSNIKVTNEIATLLNKDTDDEKEKAIEAINLEINYFANQILYDLDIDLTYKESFQLNDLLRMLKVNLNDNGNILDNLFSLIDFYALINSNKLLVFVNLKFYLEKNEILELYKHIIANNITSILLEVRASNKILENEQKLCIDSTFDDHYELHNPEI